LALEPLVPYRKSHHYLGRPGLGTCVTLAGAKINITYHEGFDRERRGVFAQNHVNVFDGNLACHIIPHAFCGLMEAWHFKIPGYGWIMSIAGSIPIYPRKEGRTQEVSDMAKLRAAEGMSILVFPEGHRTTDGKVHDYRRGVFFMARDAGLPVVPIGVRGAYEVNRKGTWKFTPGPIDVFVGPQFETDGLDEDGITRLARRLERMTAVYVETGVMPVDDDSLGNPVTRAESKQSAEASS
jgi:1-acyl-sn-glycerol-3-phosphate acyltransferase